MQLGAGVRRGHPEPQNIRPQHIDHLLRRDHIAFGFRHLQAAGIDREAMRQDLPIGLHSVDGDRGQERGLEPAPMLIGPLQVEISRKAQTFIGSQHRLMRDPGVEPDIQRVRDLLILPGPGAEQFGGVQFKPGLDPPLFDPGRDLLDQGRGVRVQFAALAVDEHGDGHAPAALPGDTPVGPVFDHAEDALLAPGRRPADRLNRGQGLPAQLFARHADKPLRRCAEDDRAFMPPAMRIAVPVGRLMQQGAGLGQFGQHGIIGLEHMLAREELRARQKTAVRADRIVHRQPVALAHDEVILAVSGRGMHRARAGRERHMLTEDERDFARIKGMPQGQALQCPPPAAPDDPALADARAGQHGLDQRLGQHQRLGAGIDQRIIIIGIDRDRPVGRQRPRGGRPDHHRHGAGRVRRLEAGRQRALVNGPEPRVNGHRARVFILNLGLGQGRAAVHAPVHGLYALLQMPGLDDLAERAHDVGLGLIIHRQKRTLPVAQDAEPPEILALSGHLFARVLAAGRAKGLVIHLHAGLARLFFDHELDRQAVAIPARHIGRVQAVQPLRLDDDVFEDLVDGVPDMDIAVGIGRPVMQDKLLAALSPSAELAV